MPAPALAALRVACASCRLQWPCRFSGPPLALLCFVPTSIRGGAASWPLRWRCAAGYPQWTPLCPSTCDAALCACFDSWGLQPLPMDVGCCFREMYVPVNAVQICFVSQKDNANICFMGRLLR